MLFGDAATGQLGLISYQNRLLSEELRLTSTPNTFQNADADNLSCATPLAATREAIRRAWQDLRETNLQNTNLDGARLYRADLHGANLTEASLLSTNFHCANLTGATLNSAMIGRRISIDQFALSAISPGREGNVHFYLKEEKGMPAPTKYYSERVNSAGSFFEVDAEQQLMARGAIEMNNEQWKQWGQ